MSTTIKSERVLSPSPQLPKKRKISTTITEPSKKRRKRDNIDNNAEVERIGASKKEKKSRRKQKENSEEDLVVLQKPSAIEDVELSDAPAEESAPMVDKVPNGRLEAVDALSESVEEEVDSSQLQSQQLSCFYEKRLSLQIPVPAISLASSTPSLLSLHLAPLLLTYFPPADGIILSFSDPVLSAASSNGVNLPLTTPGSNEISRNLTEETFARCGDGYGVCWVWLTATFLVFKPESGDELKGWTNVTSEGFVGLVSYNYFQTAVGKSRIPKAWVWNGPMEMNVRIKKKSRRAKLQGEYGESTSQEELNGVGQYSNHISDDIGDESGSFLLPDGGHVPVTQTFRVIDTEMVPGHEKDRWTLQIEGSLLSQEDDVAIAAEERKRFEQIQSYGRNRSGTADSEKDELPLMSGALPFSQAASPD